MFGLGPSLSQLFGDAQYVFVAGHEPGFAAAGPTFGCHPAFTPALRPRDSLHSLQVVGPVFCLRASSFLGYASCVCFEHVGLLPGVVIVGGHVGVDWGERELNEELCEVLRYLRVRLWVGVLFFFVCVLICEVRFVGWRVGGL